MQKNKLFTLALLCGSAFALHAFELPESVKATNQFQEFRLAQGEIYELYVKSGDGTTTVTFPSAISKIAGVNVATDGSSDFLIAAKPGSYYFNLVALKKGATGTLTVIHNRQTYILYLKQDDKKAFAAVNFAASSGGSSSFTGKSPGVTPARLLSLIDMTKGYHVLKQRYPSDLRDTIYAKNHRFFDFGKFKIELMEAVRFNREDTLVFKLLMHNNTPEEIAYDKFSFSAQVGGKTYYMSASDASGVMPPKSATWAFFTITGTPDGQRNNLAPDNEFMIGVTAKYMEEEYRLISKPVVPEVPKEDPVLKRLNELADQLAKTAAEQKKMRENIAKPFAELNDRMAKFSADQEKMRKEIERNIEEKIKNAIPAVPKAPENLPERMEDDIPEEMFPPLFPPVETETFVETPVVETVVPQPDPVTAEESVWDSFTRKVSAWFDFSSKEIPAEETTPVQTPVPKKVAPVNQEESFWNDVTQKFCSWFDFSTAEKAEISHSDNAEKSSAETNKSEKSLWDFSSFPKNLSPLVDWMKFW